VVESISGFFPACDNAGIIVSSVATYEPRAEG